MATLYGWYSIESEKEHGAKIYETVEGKVAKVSKVSHSASFRPRDMKFVGRLKKIATPNKIKASQTLATPVIPTSAAVERAKMRKRAIVSPKAESTDPNTDSTSDEPEPTPEPKRAPRPAEPKVVVNAAAERTRLRRAQNAVTPAPAVAPVVTPKQSAPAVTPKQSAPAQSAPAQSAPAAAPTRSARAAMNRAKAVTVTETPSVTTTKTPSVTTTKVAPVTTTKTPPAAVSQPPPKALIPDRVVTSRATRAARTTARPTRESAVAQPPVAEPEPVLEPIDDFLIVEDETPAQPTADDAVDDAADTTGGIGDVIDDYLPEDAVGAADVPEVDESDLDGLISSLGEF